MKPNNEKGGKKSMLKKSKRFLAGFLALLLVVTMVPTDMLSVVYAEEESEAVETVEAETEVAESTVADDDAEEVVEKNDDVKEPGDETSISVTFENENLLDGADVYFTADGESVKAEATTTLKEGTKYTLEVKKDSATVETLAAKIDGSNEYTAPASAANVTITIETVTSGGGDEEGETVEITPTISDDDNKLDGATVYFTADDEEIPVTSGTAVNLKPGEKYTLVIKKNDAAVETLAAKINDSNEYTAPDSDANVTITIETVTVTVTVKDVTSDTAEGAVASGKKVTLSYPDADAGATIYALTKTADEVGAEGFTAPTAEQIAVAGNEKSEITVSAAMTIYAVAKIGETLGEVKSFTYTIKTSSGPTTKDIVYTLNGDEVAAALGGEDYDAETGLMTKSKSIAGEKINDYFTIGTKGNLNQIMLYEAGTLDQQTTNVYIWDTSITENKTKNTVLIEGGGISATENWISFTTKTPDAKLVFYSAYKRSQTAAKELVVRKDSATSSTATWKTDATLANKTIITKYPTDKDYITLPDAATYYIGYTGGGGIVPFIQVTETVEVSDIPDAPMADPADGSVLDEGDKVSLSVLDDEATIYYTTGATADTTADPKTASDKKTYNSETKITIDENNQVIKAYAEKSTGASDVATFTYKLRVAAPEAEPEDHVLAANGGTITLKCATAEAEIYYTTDGSTPSATPSALYTEPFSVSETSVIKAIAVKTGWENSNLSEFTYFVPTTGEAEYIADASKGKDEIPAYFKLIGKPSAETIEVKKPSSSDYANASNAAFWADCTEVIAGANGNTTVINLTGGSIASVGNDVTNAVRFVTSAQKAKVVIYHSQKGTETGGLIQLSSLTDDGKVKADLASDASNHNKIVKSEFTITEPGIYAIGFRGSDKGGGIISYMIVTENPDDGGDVAPAAPTFDPAAAEGETEYKFPAKEGKVKIEAEEGATVYYVLNTDAEKYAAFVDDAEISVYQGGTEYTETEGIEVTEGLQIKAVAVKGEKASKVAESPIYKLGTLDALTGTIEDTQDPTGEIKVNDTVKVTLAYNGSETVKILYNIGTGNVADPVAGETKSGTEYDAAGITIPTSTAGTVTIKALAYTEDADGKVTAVTSVATFEYVVKSDEEPQTYEITVTTDIDHANVTIGKKTEAQADETVVLSDVATVKPDYGYELDRWTVKTADNETVTVTNGTFKMPASAVTVTPVIKSTEPVEEPTVEKPAYSPANTDIPTGGKVTVKLTCGTEGAKIYYTTNDSDPKTTGTEYTEAGIEVSATTTIKAIAVVNKGEANEAWSEELEVIYKLLGADDVAMPTANPEPTGDYVASGTKVTLSCATEGAEIYYIKDTEVDEPWDADDSECEWIVEEGRKYESPVEILRTTLIHAVAVKTTGEGDKATKKYSRVASYFYKVDLGDEYEKSYTTVYLEKNEAEHCTITVPDIVEGKTTQSTTYVTYYDAEKKATVKFAEGIDYTATWNGKGTNDQYTVTLTGLGRTDYSERSVDGYTIPKGSTRTVSYNVIAKAAAKDKTKYVDMSKEKISIKKDAVKNLYYTGYAHELKIEDFDFSKASAEVKAAAATNGLHIAYRNNINAGKATVLITMGSASEEKKDDNSSDNSSKTKIADEGIEIYADGSTTEPTTEPNSEPPKNDGGSRTCYGAKTLTFNIKKAAFNKKADKATATANILVSDMSYMEWKESEVAYWPEGYVVVTSKPAAGKKGLQLDEANYTVTCKANLKKGQATITVKGVGNNLSGNISKTVNIGAFDLSNYQIDAEYYNGTEGKPETKHDYDCVYAPKGARLSSIEVVSKDGKESLTLYEGVDYTAKYKYADKTKAAGTKVDVTKIKGANGCKGTLADITGVEIKKADFGCSAYLTGKKGLFDENYYRFYVDKDSKKGALADLQKTVIVKDYTGAALKLNKDYQIEEVKPAADSADQTVKYVVKSLDTTNYNQKTDDTPDVLDTIEIPYRTASNLAKDKNFMFDKTLEKNDPLGYDGRNPVEITQNDIDKYINKLDMTKEIQDKDRKYLLGSNIQIVWGTYKNNVKKGTAQVTIKGTGWSDENHSAFYGTKVLKFKIVEK